MPAIFNKIIILYMYLLLWMSGMHDFIPAFHCLPQTLSGSHKVWLTKEEQNRYFQRRKTYGKIGPLWKFAMKIKIYNVKIIFTNLSQNAAEFYDKYILLTILYIVWTEFGLISRFFFLNNILRKKERLFKTLPPFIYDIVLTLTVLKLQLEGDLVSKGGGGGDVLSEIEKVPRGIQGEKSRKDMASTGKMVSTIWA